jgi:hypothetical protein
MSKGTTTYDLDGIRQIARRLEMAMDSFRTDDPSEFVTAVAEYQHVAEYVNERLLDAHDRLRQGNRTDALASLESEPNALDSLQELDAADSKLEAWEETCHFLDVRRPPRLMSELAEELGAEYDAKHQIANELRTHRLLALGGGAIEQRVATLRRMLQLDPDNQHWEQDLVEYEKHCQMRLQQELASLTRGLKAGVTPAIAARIETICSKLADAEWREPLDAAIVRQSQVVLEQVRSMRVRNELANVSAALVACRAANDVSRATGLYAQWDRLAARIDLHADDPLVEDTEEARIWTQGFVEQHAAQEQVAQGIGTLSALCSQPVPWWPKAASHRSDQVRTAQRAIHAAATRAGNVTEVAAWNAAAERKIQEIQRGIGLFYALAGSILLLAIGVVSTGSYLAWQRHERGKVVDETLAEIKRLRESDSLVSKAWDYVEERFAAHPWLDGHAKTRHLPGEVETDKDKATQARKSIEENVARAVEAIDAGDGELSQFRGFETIAAGIFAARDQVRDRLDGVDRDIADAQKLLDDMKKSRYPDFATLQGSIREARDRAVQKRTEYRRRLSLVRDAEVDRIEKRIRELSDSKPDAETLEEATDELKDQVADVTRLTGKPEAGLKDQIASLIKDSERDSRMTDVQRELDRASKKGPTELLQTLETMRSRLPTELADDATSVIRCKECVDAALKWSVVADTWRSAVLGARTAVESWKTSLQAAMALPKPFPEDGAVAEQLATLTECLEQIMKPEEDVLEDLQQLDDLLASAVMQPDVIEVVVDDAIYYTTLEATKSRACHFKDEEAFDDRTIRANIDIRTALTEGVPAPARHVKLAQTLRNALKRIKAEEVSVDEGILDMIDMVFAEPDNVVTPPEPLLRVRLLSILLDIARARAFFSDNSAIEKLAEDIGVKVGEVPWVLRNDPVSRKEHLTNERLEAKKILAKRELAKSIRNAVEKKRSTLGQRPVFCRSLEYVGWANATGKGGGAVSGAPDTVRLDGRTGRVFTVTKNGDGDVAWRFADCGSLKDGKVILNSVHDAMYGQPLFLERAAVVGEPAKGSKP